MGLTINGTTFDPCPLEEDLGWLLVGWYSKQPQHHREVWARINNSYGEVKGFTTFKAVAPDSNAIEMKFGDFTYRTVL